MLGLDSHSGGEQALRDGGASASSVRPFSIALGRIGAVPAMAAEAVVEQSPYLYVYEYDHAAFATHREFSPRTWNGVRPPRTVALYTAPQSPAQANAREVLAGEPAAWLVDGLNGTNERTPSVWLRKANAESAAAMLFNASIEPLDRRTTRSARSAELTDTN